MINQKKQNKKKKYLKRTLLIMLVFNFLTFFSFIVVKNALRDDEILESDNDKITQAVSKNKNKNDIKENAPQNNEEYLKLKDGKYKTKEGFILEKKDGIAYINGIIITNKTYSLTKEYVPLEPYKEAANDNSEESMDKQVAEIFEKMKSDALKEGISLFVKSGCRSYEFQNMIYNHSVKVDGQEKTDLVSARPGHSEHQTGMCMDINSVEDDFSETPEGKWLDSNAYKYGFVLRYPKGKENETGYAYESWHYRYVGEKLAKKLYNNGEWISLEKHFGLSSNY